MIAASETRIIFDMSGLTHADSAAIGVFVKCLTKVKNAGGALRIAAAHPMIVHSLQLTRVDKLIEMFPTVDQAAKKFSWGRANQSPHSSRVHACLPWGTSALMRSVWCVAAVMRPATNMLIFNVYDQTHRRAAERTRLEFRGFGGQHRRRPHSRRGNFHRGQQSRRRSRDRARPIARHRQQSDSLERSGARNLRPPGGRGSQRASGRPGLPGRLHAPALAHILSRRFPIAFSIFIPRCCPLFPGSKRKSRRSNTARNSPAAPSTSWTKISTPDPSSCKLPLPIEDHDTEASLSEKILREEHRIYTEAVKLVLAGQYKITGRRVTRAEK